MTNTNTSSTSSGVGFTGLLTILFIGLKLAGFINWSWFWVLFPTILSVSVAIIFFIGLMIYYKIKMDKITGKYK